MKITIHQVRRTLPDFLIVGAARAGTTSLHQLLSSHPSVYMPTFKEPSFLYFHENDEAQAFENSEKFIWDLSAYVTLFEGQHGGALTGEASTVYLTEPDVVINNIRKIYGEQMLNVKIIIILREPVDRAWSMHSHFVQSKRISLSFDAVMAMNMRRDAAIQKKGKGFDYVAGSLYARAVHRYMETFSHVKVLMYDDLVADQAALLSDVCGFLEIQTPTAVNRPIIANVSGHVKDNFWGHLYKVKKRIGRSKVRSMLEKSIPQSVLNHLKRKVDIIGVQKEVFDLDANISNFGHLFVNDLIELALYFARHDMQQQEARVTAWLKKYPVDISAQGMVDSLTR